MKMIICVCGRVLLCHKHRDVEMRESHFSSSAMGSGIKHLPSASRDKNFYPLIHLAIRRFPFYKTRQNDSKVYIKTATKTNNWS